MFKTLHYVNAVRAYWLQELLHSVSGISKNTYKYLQHTTASILTITNGILSKFNNFFASLHHIYSFHKRFCNFTCVKLLWENQELNDLKFNAHSFGCDSICIIEISKIEGQSHTLLSSFGISPKENNRNIQQLICF